MTVDYEKRAANLVDAFFDKDVLLTSRQMLVDAIERLLRRVAHEAKEDAGDGWVSVEERLPASGDDVLVWGTGIGFAGTGEVRIGTWWEGENTKDNIEFHGRGHWTAGEAEFKSHDAQVTHWRELPTPPKTDSEKGSMK